MQKSIYIKNAAILTATSLILRAVGMFFRIYIAAQIGAAGMGLFQLIMTVYALCVTFASAGISVLATRITAQQMALNKNSVLSSMNKVVKLASFLGISCAAVLFVLAKPISAYVLHDVNAVLPLQILAPSLPFMALSAALRGYFLAVKRVGPNAKAQILEQIIRIGVVIVMLYIIDSSNLMLFVCAVVFGNTISEAISWVYMLYSYKKAVRNFGKEKSDYTAGFIAKILAPIAAAQYTTGTLRTIENILVPFCIAMFLGSRELAVEQFGALKGMALPVLFFPFSFISTLATLLLPDITSAYIQKQHKILQRLVSRVIFITLSISVLAGGIYTVFAQEIAMLLYNDESIAFYILVLGPLTPFMYLESMVDGILKGLNEQVATFRYTVADCVIRIILIYILLPKYGMMGFMFVMLVSNLLTCILNLRRLLSVTRLKFSFREWLIGPAIACACTAMCWYFAILPFIANIDMLVQTIIGACLYICIYALLLPVLTGVNIISLIFKKT